MLLSTNHHSLSYELGLEQKNVGIASMYAQI